jgi:hypothetical protein
MVFGRHRTAGGAQHPSLRREICGGTSMIRPLRQRHRHMIFALGIFLPVAFIAGLAARKSVPVEASLPPSLIGDSPRFEHVVWDRADLWPTNSIRTRLLSGKDRFAVELSIGNPIVKPDLLVYWSAGAMKETSMLPDNAALLGAFVQTTPVALLLPESVSKTTNGEFLLYSLADHEVVGTSQTVTLGKP